MNSRSPQKALLIVLVGLVLLVGAWLSSRPPGQVSQSPKPHASGTVGGPKAAAVRPQPRTTAPIGFASTQKLEDHYAKHGHEFGNISQDEYMRRAQALRDAPVGDQVLEAVRNDKVVSRYGRSGGEFIAFERDGTIRTFFRPNDGERYFRRQANR